MHLTYIDGQKVAQFDNIKFYVSWKSLFSNKPTVNKLYANRLNVKLSSNDKYLQDFINNLLAKGFSEIPNIKLREYSLSYKNKESP